MEKVLTSKSNKLVRIGLDGRTYIAAGAMKGNIAFPKSTTSLNSDYDLMSAVKIKFRINEESFESYHTFRGGKEFRPVLPRTLLAPGDVVAISIGGLSRQNFLDELPNLRFRNVSGVRWVSDVAVASIAKHDALRLWIRFRQSDSFQAVKSIC